MKVLLSKKSAGSCLGLLAAFAFNVNAQTPCESAGITVPDGFTEVVSAHPVSKWPTPYAPVQASWNGGIQSGCTVKPKAGEEVAVYRAWGGGNTYSGKFGSWWSLDNPSVQYPTVTDWRASNAVCPTFNTATTITKCTLKSNTQVVIGNTQSIYYQATPGYADCVYPSNNTLQLYIYPTNTAFVDNCEDETSDAKTPTAWLGR